MRRDSIKHWNVSLTREELDVSRKVFADYVTERLSHNLDKSDVLWLREVDRVGRKLQHTGPK